MPTTPRKAGKPTRTTKVPMTRREYVASVTESDLSEVLELPAADGCVPILSVAGYLYVVELPTDHETAVNETLARLARMERLTTNSCPGVAVYAEPPEGAEQELDIAEQVLAQLTAHMESDCVTAGTKGEAVELVRAHGGRFSDRTNEATFPDGSSITFGQSGRLYGPLFIRYADGCTMPVLAGREVVDPTVH